MKEITVKQIDNREIPDLIPGIVNVFRDDEVVPWHRYDDCLEIVKLRNERGFYIIVAYYDNKIAGYSEWIVTYDKGVKVLYLDLMQVDCDLRGRRIGTAMLCDGEKYAESIGMERLRTSPEDERAHNFYRKYGFIDTDLIYYCVCPTRVNNEIRQNGNPAVVTLEVADTNEFIFGVCQASSRHMYEVANHSPEKSAFKAITLYINSGYLQFRYREGTKKAMALYWSNNEVTAETISDILTQGYMAGFDEIGFYFKSKHKSLFADYNVICESTEIEKEI